jgi:RecB family exonuclease
LLAEVQDKLPRAGYASVKSRERAHAQALKTVEAVYKRFSEAELPLETEKPFNVELPDAKLKIIGRIDAVYQRDNGVEIRDFKTGTSVTTAEKAKSRATGSNQLTLYALAWQLQHDEMPALLTLDFVETGQIGSVRKQAKSLETLTAKLHDMVADLLAGNYPAGRDHVYCNHPL